MTSREAGPTPWTRTAVAVEWTPPTLVYPVPVSGWLRHAADHGGDDTLAPLLGGT